MKKIFALLLTLTILLLSPSLSFAGRGHGSSGHSSSTRSTHVKTYVPQSKKTVHVRAKNAFTKLDVFGWPKS